MNINTKKIINISSDLGYDNIINTNDFNRRLGNNYQNYTKLSLLYAEIPKSYYMFDNTTDSTITVTENLLGVDSVYDILVSINYNYSAYDLAYEIETILNIGSIAHGNSVTYTMTYIPASNKFVITSSNGAVQTSFQWSATSDFGKYLGIGDYETNILLTTDWTSPVGINLQRYQLLQINFSIANNKNDNVAGSVFPSNFPYGSMISYKNDNMYNSCSIANQYFDSIRIWITDSKGRSVNLQQNDTIFQFLLE